MRYLSGIATSSVRTCSVVGGTTSTWGTRGSVTSSHGFEAMTRSRTAERMIADSVRKTFKTLPGARTSERAPHPRLDLAVANLSDGATSELRQDVDPDVDVDAVRRRLAMDARRLPLDGVVAQYHPPG